MTFKKLGKYWHDLYYSLAPQSGIELAMTCKDITGKIDLHEVPKGGTARLRFWLHISLCLACRNYLKLSKALEQVVKVYAKKNLLKTNVEQLHQNLLEKFLNK